nr:PREDICTED: SH3 domain-binding glutamic acid-rich-like protein 2 isoform X1 [Anolis carolinensis]|eukprot:XP_008120148.1 PREDICTED: SH3 domain-binding glutamic acid-rich-like protein 2 isoform X1 [Anolis carolinensis]
MVIRVFIASSSGSVAMKKRQQDIVRFLEANKIDFVEVDITMSEEQRRWMYKNIPKDKQPSQGNPLPPQIFSDDEYRGFQDPAAELWYWTKFSDFPDRFPWLRKELNPNLPNHYLMLKPLLHCGSLSFTISGLGNTSQQFWAPFAISPSLW